VNSAERGKHFHAALVSTPWPLFNRPSIQLGALKAYLAREMPALQVSSFHFYLTVAARIGYSTYQALCERTWLAESVYAALMYPRRTDRIEALFRRESVGNAELAGIDFRELVARVGRVSKSLVGGVDWRRFGLVGFSLSLCQLTSSLYFIRQVRRASPDTFIVVGGSTFSGTAARRLAAGFVEIDAVVQGEGELPLTAILAQLVEKGRVACSVPGVVTRHDHHVETRFSQLPSLDRLPVPDYDDYFALLGKLPPARRFFPTLPVEASRGCWWRRPTGTEGLTGCAFCNLNLQWSGYRSKDPVQVATEVDRLSRRYQLLSLAFMDNVLPLKGVDRLFEKLTALGRDFKFFAEIRAGFSVTSLSAMAAAGVEEVQVGVEALSTRLLQKLNKGTSAIENLEIMKNCEALGIKSRSNLIVQFPGSDARDVAQTLAALEFAMVFRPLRVVGFWLGCGSPVWTDPEKYGVTLLGNHRHYAALFPEPIFRELAFMIQSYRGDMVRQRRLWQPVKKKVRQWQRTYQALHADSQAGPILSFRDGGDFLILRQRRLAAKPMIHRLRGISRQVYLFCGQRRSLESLRERFPQLGEDRLLAFLKMMVSMKLMFSEKDQYLSLAVAIKACTAGSAVPPVNQELDSGLTR
jgi:ribosomal peptide maturation radical SAM protein 1